MTHEERRKRRQAMAKLIEEGEQPEDVAKRFEVSMTTVRNACKEHEGGVNPKEAKAQLDTKILDALGEGESDEAVAETLGVSKYRVANLRTKRVGRKAYPLGGRTYEVISELIKGDHEQAGIAKKLGVSRQRVNQILISCRGAGIPCHARYVRRDQSKT